MVLLIGFLVSSVSALSAQLAPSLAPVSRLLSPLAGLLWIMAVVMAFMGLREVARDREKYPHGKGQAITTLIVFGVILAVITLAYFVGRSKLDANQPRGGTSLEFAEDNFRFKSPGRPWVKADAVKINKAARMLFLRNLPQVFFMVIPEQVGTQFRTESLKEVVEANVRSVAKSVKVLQEQPRTVSGLRGICIHREAKVSRQDIFYVHWVCVTNGWAYQLVTWGQLAQKQAVIAQAGEMMSRFEMIDPARRASVGGLTPAEDFVSTNGHFQVRCQNTDWIQWDDLDADCEYAAFGVYQEQAALVAATVALPGTNLNRLAVLHGLLGATGHKLSSEVLESAQGIQEGGYEGIELQFEGKSAKQEAFTYRFKLVQNGLWAGLAGAWVESGAAERDAMLKETLARVEFLPPTDPPPGPEVFGAREKRVHQLLLNAIGLQFYRQEHYEEAMPLFLASVQANPEGTNSIYLENYAEAAMNAGKYRGGLDELEAHADLVNKSLSLQATRAFLLGSLGESASAISNYSRVFAAGYRADGYFRDYVHLLGQADQWDKAFAELNAYLSVQDSPSLRLLEADLLKQRKKYDEAIELLLAQRKKQPLHRGLALSLGDAYIQAGRGNDALALANELLTSQGNTGPAWFLKGRSQFALKWYREAKSAFERALKESPQDAEIKSFLDVASGMLGEGANSIMKDPIDPVPLPPELTGKEAEPPPDFGKDHGVYYPRRVAAVSFVKGKAQKTTDYISMRTLSAAGVSACSTIQIPVHPLSEEVFMNRLEVLDPGGSIVSTGRVEDCYLLDERSGSMATSRKILNIPVSGLSPGCRLNLVLTRREFGSASEFSFVLHKFSRHYPVLESVLYVVGDTNRVRGLAIPDIRPESIGPGLVWRAKNPPVTNWEPYLPSTTDYLPMLWLADSESRWPAQASNYLHGIREQLTLTDELRQRAVKLTSVATNQAQKIAAIAAFTQTNLTYKAIEFGRRGRLPNAPATTLQNRYGDCKDHAVLAQQMLKAVGVDASLALVSTSDPIREEVPDLDQFDHMIVHVPGDRFLDCTAKGADPSAPWTLNLAGHKALVLDPVNPRIVTIVSYPTNASLIRIVRDLQVTNQSDLMLSEEVIIEGLHAAWFRDYFRQLLPDSRRSYLASQFVPAGGDLLSHGIEGIDDLQLPLRITFKSLVRGQVQRNDRQLTCAPPLGVERSFLEVQSTPKRLAPFETDSPLRIATKISLRAPANLRPRQDSAPDQHQTGPFLDCHSTLRSDAQGWTVTCDFYRPAGRHPADRYQDFASAAREAMQMLKPQLVGEATAPP
jgi:tetratricopeptide (TPR) repeat protein